jgi:ferredoxin-NADP reductase
VLAGTGTGLAPLLGIARDALARGHRGPIVLHHGARSRAGLYADAEVRELARRHPTLEVAPCVLETTRWPAGRGAGDAIAPRSIKARPAAVRSLRRARLRAHDAQGGVHGRVFSARSRPTPSVRLRPG